MIKVYYVLKTDDMYRTGDSDTAIGRRLLGYALRWDHGITLSDTAILMEERGKPFLPEYPNVHFNISHTATAVACAVSDSPVGLDIQNVSDRNYDRIKRRMFTENEQAYAGDDPVRFCEIWTKKESFVKLTGEGITRKFSEFDVLTGENTGGVVFYVREMFDAVLSVCTAAEDSVIFEKLTTEDISKGSDKLL